MNVNTVTQEALGLTLQERVELAQAVWASIDEQLGDSSTEAAVSIARERDAEWDAGKVTGLTHDEVLEQARRQLR